VRKITVILTMLLGLTVSGNARATLFDRGSGLIFDDVLNITWLQDASFVATEISEQRALEIIAEVGSIDGHTLVEADFRFGLTQDRTNWWGAMAWAEALTFGGFDDWRLPKMGNDNDNTSVADCTIVSEVDCRGNEYAYMFYQNLGGTGKSVETGGLFPPTPITGDVSVGTVDLLNILELAYWSSTKRESQTGAWAFNFFRVEQVGANKDGNYTYAWAVRDGDIAPIPEPSTLLLLASGLAGLAAWRRRKAA